MRNHTRRLRIASLVIGLVAVVAGTLVSASPAAATNADEIYSFWSLKCLQPVDGSTEQGAAIVQQPCDQTIAQQWTLIPMSGNIFHLKNSLSQLCLDARGGAADGTPVQQWTCNSISNENWELGEQTDSDTIPPLISRVSGTSSHCLDMPDAQPIAGLAMQIYGCNRTVAQQWWIPFPPE
jgi:hypothetical protein